jgi:predicted Rossmann fold flavoprotein
MPGTGSDGTGLDWLRRLGVEIHPTYPALTPLTAEPPVHAGLAGISLEVTLTATGAGRGYATRGGFLFTHRGYSGPSVLDISHWATRSGGPDSASQPIVVQWTDLDAAAWEERLRSGSGAVVTALRRVLPDRLADSLLAEAAVDPVRTHHQLTRDERRRLVDRLARYPLPWTGDEGYRKAEVTGGGVALAEVEPRALESRKHPGLFLCGEILDAFGPIGGHNFSWAWATGRLAGLGAARRVEERQSSG